MKRFALCFLALVMIFSTVSFLGCPGSGPEPPLTVTVSPKEVEPGGEITVTVEVSPPQEVELWAIWLDDELGPFSTDASGEFSRVLHIDPQLSAGEYEVLVVVLQLDLVGSASVTVVAGGEIEVPPGKVESSKNILFIEGGEVALPSGASISIPPGALDDDSTVTVSTVSDRPEPRNSNMVLGSQVYEFSVEGQHIFEIPVIITIPYRESELPPGVAEEDIRVAYYDEVAEDWIPAGGEVDTKQNLVSVATTHLSKQKGLSEWWHSKWVSFADKYRTHYFDTDNFRIEYVREGPNAVFDMPYLGEIAKALEGAKKKLEEMGFKTRGKVIQPIEVVPRLVRVVVTDIRDDKGDRQHGEELPSAWGDDYSFIRLNNSLRIDTIKAAAAHEYFHLSQDLYFTNIWRSKTYLWFCEATALWFEDIVYPEYNGYADLLDKNNHFISKALNTESGEHGYGAASFIKFLAWEHDRNARGINLVRKVFEAIEKQSMGSQDAIRAIDSVLNTYGTDIEMEFYKFADRYYTARDFDDASKWQVPWNTKDIRKLSADEQFIELEFLLPPLSAKVYVILIDKEKEPVKGTATVVVAGISNLNAVRVCAGRVDIEIVKYPVFEMLYKDGGVIIHKFGMPLGDGANKTRIIIVAINANREKSFDSFVSITIEEEPDLTVTPVSAPASAKVGDSIEVSFTVENKGGSASALFSTRVSLSPKNPWGTDYPLGNLIMDPLEAGGSQPKTVSVTIPQVPPGDYYVTVFCDQPQEISEADEQNNIGTTDPQKISIEESSLTGIVVAEGQIGRSAADPSAHITKNYVQLTINTVTGDSTGVVNLYFTQDITQDTQHLVVDYKIDVKLKGTYIKGEEGEPDMLEGTYEAIWVIKVTTVDEGLSQSRTVPTSSAWLAEMDSEGKIKGVILDWGGEGGLAIDFEATVQK